MGERRIKYRQCVIEAKKGGGEESGEREKKVMSARAPLPFRSGEIYTAFPGVDLVIYSDNTASLVCFPWSEGRGSGPRCCLETCHFHVCRTSVSGTRCDRSLKERSCW